MSKGDFMNIQKVAQRLDKSELTIRRWIKSGKLAATMTNGKWDISGSALNNISNNFAQFITECSNLKWSNNLTNSPLFALLAILGSNAACKITSDC